MILGRGKNVLQMIEKTISIYSMNDVTSYNVEVSVGLCVGLWNGDDDRDNREPRVDNGSTSTNGITLFKATSSILCKIIQQILYNCPNLV